MDQAFTEARIARAKIQILAIETAIDALAAGNIASYTLDTGQTREVVTKRSLSGLERVLDATLNRLATLEARLNGAAIQARPGW